MPLLEDAAAVTAPLGSRAYAHCVDVASTG